MRLTKKLRENIVKAALLDIFKTREDADAVMSTYLVQEISLLQAIPDQAQAKKDDEYLKSCAARIKEKYRDLCTAGGVDTDANSYLRETNSGTHIYHYQLLDGVPVRGTDGQLKSVRFEFYGKTPSYVPSNLPPDLREKLDNFLLTHSKLKGDKNSMERTLNGCLDSVTTVKRLVEVYPDLEKYVPKGVTTSIALAVSPVDLIAEMAKMREANSGRKVGKLKAARLAKKEADSK